MNQIFSIAAEWGVLVVERQTDRQGVLSCVFERDT